MSKKRRKNRKQQSGARSGGGASGGGRRSRPEAARKKGLTFFEIMVIGLVAAWVAAFFLSRQLDAPVHVWVTLATYLGSGAVLLIRPVLFVEYMAKRNEAIWDDAPRIAKLNRRVRVVAVVLLALGLVFGYLLINSSMFNSLGIYGIGDDTGVYSVESDAISPPLSD
ncbi:MAG: hypothetical protein LBH21_02285 [Gracilibacteraceae bacterium]|jgi:hypothetical protein|nr:hypothetical protein [Gracilibacteraceae bacterium]